MPRDEFLPLTASSCQYFITLHVHYWSMLWKLQHQIQNKYQTLISAKLSLKYSESWIDGNAAKMNNLHCLVLIPIQRWTIPTWWISRAEHRVLVVSILPCIKVTLITPRRKSTFQFNQLKPPNTSKVDHIFSWNSHLQDRHLT